MLALALVVMSCSALGVAARAGALPSFDWQVPTGAYERLLIHNGPTFSCSPYALRDSCSHRSARYEFYIHYITPERDQELIWFLTQAP
jgi:hypothetical protein